MQIRFVAPALLLAAASLALPFAANSQTVGGTVLGVSQTVYANLANGWSVKKDIMGKEVYNDDSKPDVVGHVEDIIINPKGSLSYAIVNASKYLGMSSHDVLIPVEQFKIKDNRITLPGATKDALRNLPEFKYSRDAGKNLK